MSSTKICKNCVACLRLYRRFYMYYPDKIFYCADRDELTDPSASCVKWRRAKRKSDLSPARFECAKDDIARIAELLDE